jgi:LPXTG-motif cell wall-anchored protein
VQLPTGTQLEKDSTTICDTAIAEPANPRRFNCLVPPLEPFEISQIDFDVRITGPVTDTGTVTTRAFGPGNDLDINRANDTAPITITVVAGYDLIAIGATVNAAVGSVVRITVGVKNLGPAPSIPDVGSVGTPMHAFIVQLPAGAQLTEHEASICPPARFIAPTHPHGFNCRMSGLAPGESQLVTFDVRITAPVSGSGNITRRMLNYPDQDTNRSNDTAAITITTKELPQTGADAKMIAATGAGTAVLGALLLLTLRQLRRRRQQHIHRLS